MRNILINQKVIIYLLLIIFISFFVINFQTIFSIVPKVSDEFAHLILSEIFLSGDLTYPAHQFPEFFQATHLITDPRIFTKYPPMIGLILAFGELVFGNKYSGILFCYILTIYFTYAILKNFVKVSLQYLIIPIIFLNYKFLDIFVLNYWGSIPALLGSTLILNAYLVENKKKYQILIKFIIGSILIFFTRPYEGLVFLILTACFFKSTYPTSKYFKQYLIIISLNLLLFITYNKFTTASFLVTPYQFYLDNYGGATPFLFTEADVSQNLHPDLQLSLSKEKEFYQNIETKIIFFVNYRLEHLKLDGDFLFFGQLWILLIVFYCYRRSQVVKIPFYFLILYILTVWPVRFHNLHYLSCLIIPAILIWVLVLNLINRSLLLKLAILFLCCLSAYSYKDFSVTYSRYHPSEQRNLIAQKLNDLEGQHLIFVKSKFYDVRDEIIYNHPNIDNQKIIWARDYGYHKNLDLINYYKKSNVDIQFWAFDYQPFSYSIDRLKLIH